MHEKNEKILQILHLFTMSFPLTTYFLKTRSLKAAKLKKVRKKL